MRLGMILLAILLIIQGMISIFSLSFQNIGLVMGLLALVAGVCILVAELKGRL